MGSSPRLGGFKVLKDVVRISAAISRGSNHSPSQCFKIIAQEKINLPYVTCVQDENGYDVNMVVEASDAERISQLTEAHFGRIFVHHQHSAVLSLFPHKSDFEITGSLFEVFCKEGVEADAMANSPSAISVILKEELVHKASEALFQPFSFSAYRTPADWKLAQKEREQIYKEVVASYQEKRPRVYGLDYQDRQELLRIKLDRSYLGRLGIHLKELARLKLNLTFLAKGPSRDGMTEKLLMCIPESGEDAHLHGLGNLDPMAVATHRDPVATFSMNGPHFGDRYGITSELLRIFQNSGVDLLALNCTIASIVGVVPSHHMDKAIQAIQSYFEVPAVTERRIQPCLRKRIR